MATITFVHAHPDDEAILTGGTMAGLAEQGHRVVLVSATRGELGETPAGLLGADESLAERRMAELAEAARRLGVARLVFLDYLDSGMADEPSNQRPGSFASADVDQAAGELASILVEESSDVVVIYDEHGGYGHPDHVQVHRVGLRAADLAETPVVYMATVNRDFYWGLASQIDNLDWEPPAGWLDGIDVMGEPAARLTTEVDVTPWIEAKRSTMMAHPSQIAEDSFFLAMPEDVFAIVWGREWYIRLRPDRGPTSLSSLETELFLGVAGAPGAPAVGADR
jgi:LmbE family N-acetylglucosaminyl deacetylase